MILAAILAVSAIALAAIALAAESLQEREAERRAAPKASGNWPPPRQPGILAGHGARLPESAGR